MTPAIKTVIVGLGVVVLGLGVWMMAHGVPFAIIAATAGGALIGFIFVKPRRDTK